MEWRKSSKNLEKETKISKKEKKGESKRGRIQNTKGEGQEER